MTTIGFFNFEIFYRNGDFFAVKKKNTRSLTLIGVLLAVRLRESSIMT